MKTSVRPRAHLAGPDVFLPNAAEIGAAKRRLCEAHGIEGAYPGDGDYRRMAGLDPREAGVAAFDDCIEMIDSCDLGFVNMTPFRGPSMDVGTAVELGYMYAKRMPVFGYSAVASSYAERISPDGLFVEPFDLCEILMAPGAVKRSTGELPALSTAKHDPPDPAAMDAFAESVRRAAAYFAIRR